MEVTRLFDLLEYRRQTQPDRAVFVAKYDGNWKKIYIDEKNKNKNFNKEKIKGISKIKSDNVLFFPKN